MPSKASPCVDRKNGMFFLQTSFPLAVIISLILHIYQFPKVCDMPNRPAHFHNLNPWFQRLFLIEHFAVLKSKKLAFVITLEYCHTGNLLSL